MVKKVAARFYTFDRQDLEAELLRQLLALKLKRPIYVRNWSAYCAKFLLNRASNLIRDSRKRQARTLSLNDWNGDGYISSSPIMSMCSQDPLDHIALVEAWKAVPRGLRRIWRALLEENGKQVKTANRIGLHRNTVRLRLQEIRDILASHGYESQTLNVNRQL